jgi:histidine ammonia-lyase
MAAVTIGARKLLNQDVILVAKEHSHLELDAATLERCAAEAKRGKRSSIAFDASAGQGAELSAENALPEPEARAAVVARLSALMQTRSGVRADVISFLTDLLNAHIVPLLPASGEGEGAAIARAVLGMGSAITPDGLVPLLQAATAAGITPLSELTSAEGETLALHSFAATGALSAAAAAAVNALDLTDGVAAATLEAAQAFTEPLHSTHFDACRQHRGQMDVAERLRLLLSGSRAINSRAPAAGASGKDSGKSKGGKGKKDAASDNKPTEAAAAAAVAAKSSDGSKATSSSSSSSSSNSSSVLQQDADAIRAIPQYHGPAREAVLAVAKAAEIELNSSESGPLTSDYSCAGPYNLQQVSTCYITQHLTSDGIIIDTRSLPSTVAADCQCCRESVSYSHKCTNRDYSRSKQ